MNKYYAYCLQCKINIIFFFFWNLNFQGGGEWLLSRLGKNPNSNQNTSSSSFYCLFCLDLNHKEVNNAMLDTMAQMSSLLQKWHEELLQPGQDPCWQTSKDRWKAIGILLYSSNQREFLFENSPQNL